MRLRWLETLDLAWHIFEQADLVLMGLIYFCPLTSALCFSYIDRIALSRLLVYRDNLQARY